MAVIAPRRRQPRAVMKIDRLEPHYLTQFPEQLQEPLTTAAVHHPVVIRINLPAYDDDH